MTDEKKTEGPTDTKEQEIRQVEEMYRQADQKYGGFAERGSSSKKVSAPLKRNLPEQAANTASKPLEHVQNPIWILNVLEDLKTFTYSNGLPRLAKQLDDTAIVAISEIAIKMNNRDGSK